MNLHLLIFVKNSGIFLATMRILTILFATIVGMVCTISCRTSSTMVSSETSQNRSAEIKTTVHVDSVYVLDSVFVSERNCTIIQHYFHTEFRYLGDMRTDTIHDTIQHVTTEYREKIIEKQISAFVKFLCVFMCAIPTIFMLYNIFKHFSHK